MAPATARIPNEEWFLGVFMTTPPSGPGHRLLSSILRHDAKQNSYKFALLRALNDVVLAYPDVRHGERPIAVPVRRLAEAWLAYYWPFMAVGNEIMQGPRAKRGGQLRNDMAFRPSLRDLRARWEAMFGHSAAGDGWMLVEQMRVPRLRDPFDATFRTAYRATVRKIADAVRQPLQYAGEGEWSVFTKPRRANTLPPSTWLPGTRPNDACTLVQPSLWNAFRDVSLWVEALAIHEWSLFTARVGDVPRGEAYERLTERPDGVRLPVTWERNEVVVQMLEGRMYRCPWSGKRLSPDRFQLDHIVPVSIHPFHELWNLVPADPATNMHVKRARLPSATVLRKASPILTESYRNYAASDGLAGALIDDVARRFRLPHPPQSIQPEAITHAVIDLTTNVAELRHVAQFDKHT